MSSDDLGADRAEKLFAGASRVLIATLIISLLGFLRDIAVARAFGLTAMADAFAVTLGVSMGVGNAIFGSILLLLTPEFTKEAISGFQYAVIAWKYVRVPLIVLSIGGAAVSLAFLFGSGNSTQAIAEGYVTPGVVFSVVLLPLFYVLAGVFGTAIRAERRYGTASVLPGIRSLALLLALSLLSNLSITDLLLIFPIGLAIEILIGIWCLARWKTGDLGKSTDARRASKSSHTVLPAILISLLPTITFLTDKAVLIGVETGGIASLEYAYRLFVMPHALLSMSLISVWFVEFSRKRNDRGRSQQAENQLITFQVLFGGIGFVTLLFLFLPGPVVQAVFGSGKMGAHDLHRVASILRFYGLGLLPLAWGAIVARVAFVVQEYYFAMKCAVCAAVLNLLLDIVFVRVLGAEGVALCSTMVSIAWPLSLLTNSKIRSAAGADKWLKTGGRALLIMGVGPLLVLGGAGIWWGTTWYESGQLLVVLRLLAIGLVAMTSATLVGGKTGIISRNWFRRFIPF